MSCPNCEMARIRQMIENKQRQRALEEQKRIADIIAKKKEARMQEQKLKEEPVVPENIVSTPVPEERVVESTVKSVYESPVIEIVEEPEVKIEAASEQMNEPDNILSEDNVEVPIVQKPVQQQKPKTSYSKKKKKNNKK